MINACVAMMPRLSAEESILAANRAAVGSGALTSESRDEIARTWQTAASSGATRPSQRLTPRDARAMGIKVVRAHTSQAAG